MRKEESVGLGVKNRSKRFKMLTTETFRSQAGAVSMMTEESGLNEEF